MGNIELVKMYEAISYEEAAQKEVTFTEHLKMKLIVFFEALLSLQGVRHIVWNDKKEAWALQDELTY